MPTEGEFRRGAPENCDEAVALHRRGGEGTTLLRDKTGRDQMECPFQRGALACLNVFRGPARAGWNGTRLDASPQLSRCFQRHIRAPTAASTPRDNEGVFFFFGNLHPEEFAQTGRKDMNVRLAQVRAEAWPFNTCRPPRRPTR